MMSTADIARRSYMGLRFPTFVAAMADLEARILRRDIDGADRPQVVEMRADCFIIVLGPL